MRQLPKLCYLVKAIVTLYRLNDRNINNVISVRGRPTFETSILHLRPLSYTVFDVFMILVCHSKVDDHPVIGAVIGDDRQHLIIPLIYQPQTSKTSKHIHDNAHTYVSAPTVRTQSPHPPISDIHADYRDLMLFMITVSRYDHNHLKF